MAIADAENDDEDGYGNAVPVEARERLPQALANLAQTARFAHSHTRFLLLYSERRRRKSRDRNDQIKVKTLTISTPDSVQTKGSTLPDSRSDRETRGIVPPDGGGETG